MGRNSKVLLSAILYMKAYSYFNIMVRLLSVALIMLSAFPSAASIRHSIKEDISVAERMVAEGDYGSAYNIYRSLLEEYKAGHEDASLARALRWGGNVCIRTGRPVDALEFYLSALKLAKSQKDMHNVETTLVNIGIVYGLFKDYEQAVSYFEKALPLASANNDTAVMAICHTNLCAAYSELGATDKAEENLRLQKKFPLLDSVDNSFHLLHNAGLLGRGQNRFEYDIRCQRDAIGVIRGKANKEYLSVEAYLEIAKAFTSMEQYDSAYVYLQKSLKEASDNRAPEHIQSIYEELSHHFRVLGEPDSVYKYQLLYYEVSDSLYNNNRFNNVKRKLNIFEKDETNRHIWHLKETVGSLSVSLALIVVIAVILIIYCRKIWKAKQLLVKKNQELFWQVETTNAIIGNYASQQTKSGETKDEGETARSEESADGLALLTKIQRTMENLDIISNPNFSLPQLASLVESNTTYVSAVINDTFGKNFKTYLNEYRVHEACRRLTDPQYSKLTMAAIASEVGFKTQNSFIVNFKKVTGVTPSVYRSLSKAPHAAVFSDGRRSGSEE